MKHLKRAALAATFIALALFGASAMTTTATQPDENGEHKVALCHRTASDTNPYVRIEVDVASLDAHLNNLPGHPAKFNEDGSPRNDYLYTEQTPCASTTPSDEPSDSPSASPSTQPSPRDVPSPSPSVVPSDSPTPGASDAPSTVPSRTPDSRVMPPTDTEESPSTPLSSSGLGLLLLFAGFIVPFTAVAMYRTLRMRD